MLSTPKNCESYHVRERFSLIKTLSPTGELAVFGTTLINQDTGVQANL